jgi:hypothetical protein
MRFVDYDSESPPPLLVSDLVKDEREFLHRGYDDFFAALDELSKVSRVLRVADCRTYLGELFDRVANLLV